jgi:hypothetical protein
MKLKVDNQRKVNMLFQKNTSQLMEISSLSKTLEKIMLLKKLRQEKQLTASKEKVNNILMKSEINASLNHLPKEESANVLHPNALFKEIHHTKFD